MFRFTRAGVNLISFAITTIIFIFIQILIYQYSNGIEIGVEIKEEIMQNVQKEDNIQQNEERNDIWQIEIERISLIANISEGTTEEVLNEYVGHFPETQKINGNIGLAAHNRGYNVNYFEKLKILEEGDEIKYTYNNIQKTYEVVKNKIIQDTDWSELENTEENILTLITCVENEPNYRRCVKAIEKVE